MNLNIVSICRIIIGDFNALDIMHGIINNISTQIKIMGAKRVGVVKRVWDILCHRRNKIKANHNVRISNNPTIKNMIYIHNRYMYNEL